MKKIETAISDYKQRLTRKAKRVRIWENFGQEEVRVLEETYQKHKFANDGIWEKIRDFDIWCQIFTC